MLLQGINRATNAFLKWSLKGEEYQTWLLGLMEMPKARKHNATQRNPTQLMAPFWLPALWCGCDRVSGMNGRHCPLAFLTLRLLRRWLTSSSRLSR